MDDFQGYRKDLEKSIIKKALGYNYKEVIDEYSVDESGTKTLTKRKVTTKNVPPDLSAVKLLLDQMTSTQKDYSSMTDEELIAEIKSALDGLDYAVVSKSADKREN